MSVVQAFPVKKAFLYSLIASILFSALLGILAILSGRFGWVELRVILTTATVGLGSITGLACGAYLGTGGGKALPLTGIGFTSLAMAMIIAGVWAEFESAGYWKTAASLSVFAVACAHLSLLSMARLADWFQWSLIAAYAIIFGVAALIVSIILLEINERGMFQLLGVAAIVDAAITILIPIFHRLSGTRWGAANNTACSPNHADIDAEIAKLERKIAKLRELKQNRSRI